MPNKDYDSGDEEEKTVADEAVFTKYNDAGRIANGIKFWNQKYFVFTCHYLSFSFIITLELVAVFPKSLVEFNFYVFCNTIFDFFRRESK